MNKSPKKIRAISHWCADTRKDKNYHLKCGGRVSTLLKPDKSIQVEFREENFEYSKCRCYCHSKEIINKPL